MPNSRAIWYYHIEWPLELRGPEGELTGKARLRAEFVPRTTGELDRTDRVAPLTGAVELPPWTPEAGQTLHGASSTLHWTEIGRAHV